MYFRLVGYNYYRSVCRSTDELQQFLLWHIMLMTHWYLFVIHQWKLRITYFYTHFFFVPSEGDIVFKLELLEHVKILLEGELTSCSSLSYDKNLTPSDTWKRLILNDCWKKLKKLFHRVACRKLLQTKGKWSTYTYLLLCPGGHYL